MNLEEAASIVANHMEKGAAGSTYCVGNAHLNHSGYTFTCALGSVEDALGIRSSSNDPAQLMENIGKQIGYAKADSPFWRGLGREIAQRNDSPADYGYSTNDPRLSIAEWLRREAATRQRRSEARFRAIASLKIVAIEQSTFYSHPQIQHPLK